MMTLHQRGIRKPPLDLKTQKEEHPDIIEEAFWSIVPLVWEYTELPIAVLHNLYCSARYIVNAGIIGDFVECGVHMGGSVMMMEYVLLKDDKCADRRIYALDTFFGFVRRNEELDIDLRTGLPVCHPASQSDDFSDGAIENMTSVGFSRLNVIKGDVLHTIPTVETKEISLLRLDTDTYETTKFELEQLYDRVVHGGVVIVDDYGYTFGCKKAVDDFVAEKAILLQRINGNVRAWIKVIC
jgi:O-methyltransferase